MGPQGDGLPLSEKGMVFGEDDVGLGVGQVSVDQPLCAQKVLHLPAALAVKMEDPHGGAAGKYVVQHLVRAALVQPVGEGPLVLVAHDHLDKALHHMGELCHGDREVPVVLLPL